MVERFDKLILLLACLSMAWCAYYTVHHLEMNTSTEDMLSPDLEWRRLDLEIDARFPQDTNNLLVVVEATTPDAAADTAQLLYTKLNTESDLFKTVYYPAGSAFFKRSALLYLDTDELQDLADNLATIQPFLSRLAEDQSLRGLFTMLQDAVEAKLDGEEIDLEPILEKLEAAFIALENNRSYTLSWQLLIANEKATKKLYREFIILQPVLDYGSLFPAENAITKVRTLISASQLDRDNTAVHLTGSVALAHEEMLNISTGTVYSAIAAFVMVALLLLVGFRSAWLTIASMFILLAGLIYTACFATIAVGELNLISIAFAVLYIGLGADFAIHYCMHYRDSLARHHDNHTALHETTTDTGMALLLCTSTTAISFYAFMPTDYSGVAELGLISGTGMLISLVVTLTLLPALFSVIPLKQLKKQANAQHPFLLELRKIPVTHAYKIKSITVILAILALYMAFQIEFDQNTLNLQSPENESVQTYRDLLADSDTSPWNATLLARSYAEAERLSTRLESLPLVDNTVWIKDLVPEEQEGKLAIIDEMDLLLGAMAIGTETSIPADDENLAIIRAFNISLQQLIAGGETTPVYARLQKTVDRFLQTMDSLDASSRHSLLERFGHSVLDTFPERLNALLQSMHAEPITEKNLPRDTRDLWFNDGTYRIEIYPRENLVDNHALQRFVAQLQTETPRVTGLPIIAVEASNAVIQAFQQAFLYAFIATAILLLLLTEKKYDAVYILTPLLLAALFTGAISVALGMKMNFANIIALPLLLGMGIDSGIYILHGLHKSSREDLSHLVRSSSSAVILSALTTILSIGNLAFSPHLGTASLGKLLTIGLIMTLVCTLIVLPSLLAGQLRQQGNR